MIASVDIRLDRFAFDKVFLVDSRNHWNDCVPLSNKDQDLILCVDFALKHELERSGYKVQFLDHLVENKELQSLNLKVHEFLNSWHKDSSGKETLIYDNIPVGNALLLYLINDVTYFCHFLFNSYALKSIIYRDLIVCTDDQVILKVLETLGLDFTLVETSSESTKTVYSFPITKWMDEAVSKTSFDQKLKNLLTSALDYAGKVWDAFGSKKKRGIYIQSYHPTFSIIEKLIKDKRNRIVLPGFSIAYGRLMLLNQRRILHRSIAVRESEKNATLKEYRESDKVSWLYEGIDLGSILYHIVDQVVEKNVVEVIRKVKAIKKNFGRYPIHLAVPVTELWLENRIVMNYCKNHRIPVFFIANGLLNTPLMNEGRDSDFVNCHSQACKEDYFFNAPNVFALGDPRMDFYANENQKTINRDLPNIVIGAAGYDVTDMNSYLAFEFDFLYDILSSIESLKSKGHQSKIVLKVRANGYASLYDSFTKEYFSSLNVEIIQDAPFIDVVKRADLYISFYSQTIFEAATLGIPVIYYKKDTQTIFRPFDGKGDLVTATDDHTLIEKIELFYAGDSVFESFQKKSNLEKFVGPLDGNNLKRNIDFINGLL